MIIGLKQEENDIIADYEIICTTLLQRYDRLSDNELKGKLKSFITGCNKLKMPLKRKNRVYITTDDRMISLMMVDVEDCIIENFKSFFQEITKEDQEFDFIFSTIWIFEGKKLTYRSIIQPRDLATFMAIFSKENLVDYNTSRFEWKTRPRLEERRNKNNSDL